MSLSVYPLRDFDFAVETFILTVSYLCPRIPWVISHILGCFRRARDDDALGVYHGA